MKKSKSLRSLAVVSFVIALCAFVSNASFYTMGAGYGSYYVLTCDGTTTNNPNGFPVVIIGYTEASGTVHYFGFLLNGSEKTSNWLKTIQDACVNNRKINISVDDNYANGFSGACSTTGPTAPALKILGFTVYNP